ncbi:MAG TPA: pantetheine-phosphate adenylyltransferase [Gemmatales bacterium]|nr:pantetheine-phosphate adenylyltransferase [Gemmatales bacterium]
MATIAALTAVYTGMFDPVHLGHLDIIRRSSQIFPRLVIGVGINPDKSPLFPTEDRVQLLQEVVKGMPNVEVQPFSGLAVHFVRSVGGRVMVRGLRTVSDMEYEFSMSLTNQTLDPTIHTIFLLPRVEYTHLSSTLIRQIAALGGDLSRFLPPNIIPKVEAKAQACIQPPRGV